VVDVVLPGRDGLDDRIGIDRHRAASAQTELRCDLAARAERDLVGGDGVAGAGVRTGARSGPGTAGDREPAVRTVHLIVLLVLRPCEGASAESAAEPVDLAVGVARDVLMSGGMGVGA